MMSRFGSLLLLFSLAGCASAPMTPAPTGRFAAPSAALNGTWRLKEVHCLSGDLGPVGQSIASTISAGREEEIFEVHDGAVLWHVREHRIDGEKRAYCETTFSASWIADGKKIRTSGTTFKRREGVHGYKCYEPFHPESSPESSEHPYELQGDILTIRHHDPIVQMRSKAFHGCENKSDLLYVLHRE